jgi:hypothetical protein
VHRFTPPQRDLIVGPEVSARVGPQVAADLAQRFADAQPDEAGNLPVDLGESRIAVLAALREISPDAEDPTLQQRTEELLFVLS